MKKQRLDRLLVECGLAESRTQAQRLIMAGEVRVDGQVALKPGQIVPAAAAVAVEAPLPYVSRGGAKIAGALDDFGYEPSGKMAADVGASTGGFTDVLLQRGVTRVYAIDVGYGQLAWKLRQDPRVVVMERTNARHLTHLAEPVDLVVIDASFISLELLLPVVRGWLAPSGDVIALVKPQFEAGREQVGKGGVVRDEAIHRQVLHDLIAWALVQGWRLAGATASPLRGPAGNVEFFLWLTTAATAPSPDPDEAVALALSRVPT
ncbi:MAG: TlyA family RNA methyltransferase [Ardenticatenaceae bacterium]|nr:TlyA family RNA methyltransferase [Ardenticatenaceae bacterium]